MRRGQQVTFVQARNGPGVIIRKYPIPTITLVGISKKKIFRPLLASGGQSALIQNQDIFIPLGSEHTHINPV